MRDNYDFSKGERAKDAQKGSDGFFKFVVYALVATVLLWLAVVIFLR